MDKGRSEASKKRKPRCGSCLVWSNELAYAKTRPAATKPRATSIFSQPKRAWRAALVFEAPVGEGELEPLPEVWVAPEEPEPEPEPECEDDAPDCMEEKVQSVMRSRMDDRQQHENAERKKGGEGAH